MWYSRGSMPALTIFSLTPENVTLSQLQSLMTEPPQILRIKRKRGQDPLQALILADRQPAAKRSKPSSPVSSQATTPKPEPPKNWYFQLARTDNVNQGDQDILGSVLSEAAVKGEDRQFVIPKQQTEEDAVIPHELADMVDTFLNVDTEVSERKKRRGGKLTSQSDIESTKRETDEDFANDYVFDVYKLSNTEPITNANFPQSQIGYIKFFDDHEYDLMLSDDEKKSDGAVFSDDEDSNAESFYQNDYPEDEDAGALSETYDEEDENEEIGPVILESAEAAEGHAYLNGDFQQEGQYDELYEEFFDENGEQSVNFLEDDYYQNDETFERQKFFNDEEEDDLALHRDRIFGKLQRMIDERETS